MLLCDASGRYCVMGVSLQCNQQSIQCCKAGLQTRILTLPASGCHAALIILAELHVTDSAVHASESAFCLQSSFRSELWIRSKVLERYNSTSKKSNPRMFARPVDVPSAVKTEDSAIASVVLGQAWLLRQIQSVIMAQLSSRDKTKVEMCFSIRSSNLAAAREKQHGEVPCV